MSEQFRFGGVPVYNPQSLSKQEAIAQFHARRQLYQRLLDLLREKRPSHVLVIGTRGMGKTTLLQRIQYGVEDAPDLNMQYLVLTFPEEQYNVTKLHHFLLNVVDALADTMERLTNLDMLREVERYVDSISKLSAEEICEDVPRFLESVGKQTNRKFLLLVDNADRLIDTIDDKEQWTVRELLSNREDITLFGATTQASEGIFGPNRAFFEFFRIERLSPLGVAEVRQLLISLSESVEEEPGQKGSAKRRVEEWLLTDEARLHTLVQLTGGNPRTTVLLFHLVLDGLNGGVREYLEQLLDQCTPNYKGRVDELPPQAQQVLDAVALIWHPVTAMEVAAETRLETAIVSTQLTRLTRQGLLEKADPGDSKKALYQVAERFFNIWYLMRASRRVRAKLRWFVEFLRVFFETSELERLAWDHLRRFGRGGKRYRAEFETAFAYVVASGADLRRVEEYLRSECADTESTWRPYVDLIHPSAVPLTGISGGKSHVGSNLSTDNLDLLREDTRRNPQDAATWLQFGRALSDKPNSAVEAEAVLRKAIELEPSLAKAWRSLATLLVTLGRNGEAEDALRRAIGLENNASYWDSLGDLLRKDPDRVREAEEAYRRAIEIDPLYKWGWLDLGTLLMLGRGTLMPRTAKAPDGVGNALRESEDAIKEAVRLDPEFGFAWYYLGLLLSGAPSRRTEAEDAARKSVSLNPDFSAAWSLLGKILAAEPQSREEAEFAIRKAIDLRPEGSWPWVDLGELLALQPERSSEAEAAIRRAIELQPDEAGIWDALARYLSRFPDRNAEAEKAFLKTVDLHPDSYSHWANLGEFLARMPGRMSEAAAAVYEAIERAPENCGIRQLLGSILADVPGKEEQAEAIIRQAIDLHPTGPSHWNQLGRFLANQGRRTEAEEAFNKAIELDTEGGSWRNLAILLEGQGRLGEAEVAFKSAITKEPDRDKHWLELATFLHNRKRYVEVEKALEKAIELQPRSSVAWSRLGVLYACQLRDSEKAEQAFRRSVELHETPSTLRNLGVLLYCERRKKAEALDYFGRAQQLEPDNPITMAVRAACSDPEKGVAFPESEMKGKEFWHQLMEMADNYPPFGEILLTIAEKSISASTAGAPGTLYRSLALAEMGDFPRASVAFEEALVGDPIELLSEYKEELEVLLAAAVRAHRAADCISIIERKGWVDAWRPIYEALKAVVFGSEQYLKRVAVELRQPALIILSRIAPELASEVS